jgi:hypothetical protein
LEAVLVTAGGAAPTLGEIADELGSRELPRIGSNPGSMLGYEEQ